MNADTKGKKALERCLALAKAAGLTALETRTDGSDRLIRTNGETLLRITDDDTAVLTCPFEGHQVLLQTAPDIYADLPEPCKTKVVVDLSKIDDEELQLHLVQAWKEHASERALNAFKKKTG